MKTSTRHNYSLVRWVGLAVVQAWLVTLANGSSFQLVSATDPQFGLSAGGNSDSCLPVLSRDGRYVLFASTADNLVVLGTNRTMPALFPAPINVFLRDRTKGTTALVSVNRDGTGGGDGNSFPMGVSTNGRYALFESDAGNLLPGDTNNAADVFLRDLLTGTTVLVSVSTNGGSANMDSYNSVMTPDGRFVAFASAADNLVPDDTNGFPDVFVRDIASNATTLVSVGALPAFSHFSSWPFYLYYQGSDTPVITPDGRYIAFYSTATNLAPGVGTIGNVYLRDQKMGTTTWASAGALPVLQSLATASNTLSFNHALSDDGRFVVFEVVADSKPSPALILRYDTQTALADLVETNAAVPRTISYETVQNLSLTPDGRFVAYVANAIDASGTTTAIRVWDSQSGVSTPVSGNTNNSFAAGSLADAPLLDDTGRFVAFLSSAPDLVTNESPADFHVYLRDLQTGVTTVVDADTNSPGAVVDPSTTLAMSADVRFMAFDRQGRNVAPMRRNQTYDVFVRDLAVASTELISVRDPNLPSLTPDGGSVISSSSVSSDARFIAFWSEADDLVANDTNGLRDVFVRDTLSGKNVLVSVNTNGVGGNGYSTDTAISSNGRYVAFTSFADDLVNGDANGALDVFVRDLQAGTTTLVSVNSAGTGPGNAQSYSPVLSSDGQVVLFHSQANDILPGMGTRKDIDNLFWRDLKSNQTYALTTNQSANKVTAASMTPDGDLVALVTGSSSSIFRSTSSQLYVWDSASATIVYSLAGGGDCFGPLAISPNGQKVAYVTNAAGTAQLVVLDRALNTNWIIASYQGNSTSPPRFSADSRFLAYVGSFGSPVYTQQIYLYDFQTGTNLLVSRSYDGSTPGNDHSDASELSSDGRFVSYRSGAGNLVPGDTNGVPDIFLYDRSSGATALITASRFGGRSADSRSLASVFSADARTLVFESWASDLIANDFNNAVDVFALGLYGGTTAPTLAVSVFSAPGSPPSNWLSWPVAPGKTYRVQFKQSLDDAAWQDFSGQISIMGDQGYLQDAAPTATQRFYRIVAF